VVAALAPARLVRRDLAADPPPLPDAAYAAAIRARAPHHDPAFAASETYIAELEATDALVLSLPMHNYTVPATLKSWLDHVVRIGRSFDPTPRGKVGRLRDRPTYVVIATGGSFTGDAAQPDFATPYLTAILATIGLKDVRHLRLDSIRDPASREAALARAKSWAQGQKSLVPALMK
jgi:FMN-dependent NADH-azoreductase